MSENNGDFTAALDWYIQNCGLDRHKCATCEHYFETGNACANTTTHGHICEGRMPFNAPEGMASFVVTSCQFYVRAREFYKYYLRTEHWKRTRRKRIEMDGFKCSSCGSPINLNVHHVTYDRIGCEDMEDLVTFCQTCHGRLHGKVA